MDAHGQIVATPGGRRLCFAEWGSLDGSPIAVLSSWGFDCRDVGAPTALWYDRDDKVLPAQHSRWLADEIPSATLVTTNALGHRSAGDPKPDWNRLYTWLLDGS